MHALSELKGFPYLGLVEGHPLSLNFINKKKGVTSTSISTHKKNKIRYTISYLKTEKNTEFPKRLPASTEQQSHGSKDSKLSPVLVHVDPINQSNRKFKPQQERTKYPKGKRKKKSKLYIQGKTKNEGKCPIQNIPPLLNSEAPFPPFSIAKTRFTLQNFKQRTMQVKQTTQWSQKKKKTSVVGGFTVSGNVIEFRFWKETVFLAHERVWQGTDTWVTRERES